MFNKFSVFFCFLVFISGSVLAEESLYNNNIEKKVESYIKNNEELEVIKIEQEKLKEYLSLVKLKISVENEEKKLREIKSGQELNVKNVSSNEKKKPNVIVKTLPNINIISYIKLGDAIYLKVAFDSRIYELKENEGIINKYFYKIEDNILTVYDATNKKSFEINKI